MPDPASLGLGHSEQAIMAMADAEVEFEADLREYQEPDGSFACDPHVILSMAVQALRKSGVRL